MAFLNKDLTRNRKVILYRRTGHSNAVEAYGSDRTDGPLKRRGGLRADGSGRTDGGGNGRGEPDLKSHK